MSIEQRGYSSKVSNIDINSYRAYKNLLKTGNIVTPQNFNKIKSMEGSNVTNNKQNVQNYKNVTKHVFSSQSKRFLWQTDEAINRHSELNGSMANMRQRHLNSEKWDGFNNMSQDDESLHKYEKYKK